MPTTTRAYYNEFDPYAAQWLRNLIEAGHIASGDVDERSIKDVSPSDLEGYTQCHFFAGIGVWSHALRSVGWSDDREVWTGSCPCQPFSSAGKKGGLDDERHLWPEFMRLIRAKRPVVVFGEQVASKDGLAWLDIVSTDLEDSGYSFGAVDTCAAGFGAPHIRQRLYFVADAPGAGLERAAGESISREGSRPTSSGAAGRLADSELHGLASDEISRSTSASKDKGWVLEPEGRCPTSGHWAGAEWLPCKDGKYRSTEPGTFPLAHGVAERVGRLRGYGNAIVSPQAQGFIEAYMDVRGLR